jgi:DNA ligase 1
MNHVKSFILDCEVVGMKNGKILPFQTCKCLSLIILPIVMTRGRKDIKVENIQIQICLFSFDLLFLNGESLLDETLLKRREILFSSFQPVENQFQFATHLDSKNPEEIQDFMTQSVNHLCEGIMVKSLIKDSIYFPAKRSMNWLKLKKDYMNGVGDSLDLVPIGGYYGQGKRKGNYGGFLLAIYNSETEEYQSICKIGTGFSDEQLNEFHKGVCFYSNSSLLGI